MEVTIPFGSSWTRRNLTLFTLLIENMPVHTSYMTVFTISIVDIVRKTLAGVVCLLNKHILPTFRQYSLALLSGIVEKEPSNTVELTTMSGSIIFIPLVASTLGYRPNPFLSIDTYRLLTLPARSVVNRIRGITTTSVIVGEVSLRLIAFGNTALVFELIDLPLLTLAIN